MTAIIAHRGYSAYYPENTLLAFDKAADFDIWGIELDVHLTKDQEVVIIHDERIDRTSNGQGYVKDRTLQELKTFAFYGDFPQTQVSHPEAIQIPTLREFFEWFKPLSIKVNIELKTNIFRYQGINERVWGLIQEFNLADRVLISSFNHHSVVDFMKLAEGSALEFAFLTGACLLEPGTYCRQHGVGHYHPYYVSLEPTDLLNCQDQGIQVNPYTVNDKEAIQKVAAMGVDAIITNYVERALDLV